MNARIQASDETDLAELLQREVDLQAGKWFFVAERLPAGYKWS